MNTSVNTVQVQWRIHTIAMPFDEAGILALRHVAAGQCAAMYCNDEIDGRIVCVRAYLRVCVCLYIYSM